MEVSTLTVDPITGLPVVLLTPLGWRDGTVGTRPMCSYQAAMPISVGLSEASAIATELDGIELELPTTHQLMSLMLERAGVQIERVEVYDLVDGAACTRIHLFLPSGERVVNEARPSDALALALHEGTEIRVAVRVIEKIALLVEDEPWLDGPDGDLYEEDDDYGEYESYEGDEEYTGEGPDEEHLGGDDPDGPDGEAGDDLDFESGAAMVGSPAGSPFGRERGWQSTGPWDSDMSNPSQTMIPPVGGIIEGDLSQVSDEAFGKWKM